MSFKTTAQLLILLLIAFIVGFVYYNYFSVRNDVEQSINEGKENIIEQKNLNSKKKENENQIIKEEKNTNSNISNTDNNNLENDNLKNQISENDNLENNSKKNTEKEVSNILTEVEYLTIDNKGNKYKIFANSGVTNKENKDILELDQVRGIVTSEKRSTIYIVSDFAKYDSSNQNSHFYKNVIIDFEDKKINCDYFDINMQTSLAIAYGNVIVTDPKSIMKAGKITLDMETKDINIEPSTKKKVKIETD